MVSLNLKQNWSCYSTIWNNSKVRHNIFLRQILGLRPTNERRLSLVGSEPKISTAFYTMWPIGHIRYRSRKSYFFFYPWQTVQTDKQPNMGNNFEYLCRPSVCKWRKRKKDKCVSCSLGNKAPTKPATYQYIAGNIPRLQFACYLMARNDEWSGAMNFNKTSMCVNASIHFVP